MHNIVRSLAPEKSRLTDFGCGEMSVASLVDEVLGACRLEATSLAACMNRNFDSC